jgi:hypothetical protein
LIDCEKFFLSKNHGAKSPRHKRTKLKLGTRTSYKEKGQPEGDHATKHIEKEENKREREKTEQSTKLT